MSVRFYQNLKGMEKTKSEPKVGLKPVDKKLKTQPELTYTSERWMDHKKLQAEMGRRELLKVYRLRKDKRPKSGRGTD